MSAEVGRSTHVEARRVLDVDLRQLQLRRRTGRRAICLPSGGVGAPSFVEIGRDEVLPDRIVLHDDGRLDRVWQRGSADDYRLERTRGSRGYVTAERGPH